MTTKKSNLVLDHHKDEITTVQLHEKDLKALIQLLNITQETYNKLADNAVKLNDENATTLWLTRAKLAFMFAERLNLYTDIPEPSSKEIH